MNIQGFVMFFQVFLVALVVTIMVFSEVDPIGRLVLGTLAMCAAVVLFIEIYEYLGGR